MRGFKKGTPFFLLCNLRHAAAFLSGQNKKTCNMPQNGTNIFKISPKKWHHLYRISDEGK